MNKIHKIIYSKEMGQWVVVSELAKGHSKSKSSATTSKVSLLKRVALLSLSCGFWAIANTAIAGDVVLNTPFTPSDLNGGATAITGNGVGTEITVTGSVRYVENGTISGRISSDYASAVNAGSITIPNGSPIPGVNNTNSLSYGSQTITVTVKDPVTGANRVISLYDSNNINTGTGARVRYYDTPSTATVDDMYYQASLVKLTDESTVNINLDPGVIGNTRISGTNFVDVSGGGKVVWNSDNSFKSSALSTTEDYDTYFEADGTAKKQTIQIPIYSYIGSVTVNTSDGVKQFVINSDEDIKNYNNALIQLVKDGKLGSTPNEIQTRYNAAIAGLKTSTTYEYEFQYMPDGMTRDDAIFAPKGQSIVAAVSGNNSNFTLSETGRIELESSGLYGLSVTNGATANIDGILQNYQSDSVGLVVSFGSTAIIGETGHRIIGREIGGYSLGSPDVISDNSSLINKGNISIYGSEGTAGTSRGITVTRSSNMLNDTTGVINVGVKKTQSALAVQQISGIRLYGNSELRNKGLISLGREDENGTIIDTIQNQGINGVQLESARFYNEGQFITGEKVQGVSAITLIHVDGYASNESSGEITLNTNYNENGAFPKTSYAIAYQGAGTGRAAGIDVINNQGVINLNGANGIGIYVKPTSVVGAGGTVRASSSGTINVNSPVGGSQFGNYGIWAEGKNAEVGLSGKIVLSGDKAIGVFAGSGGKINITGNGEIIFAGGKNQVGYFIDGKDAEITNAGSSIQNVSSEGSVLFRLENGAMFAGGSGANSELIASGKNSKAIIVTGGDGATEQFNSGNMTLKVSGDGATGVVVEGGSIGTITSGANIQLLADGAIAARVDGQRHDVNNNAIGAANSKTKLNSSATLTSAQSNVTGYVVANSASLEHTGTINFSGSGTGNVGVAIEKGILENKGTIQTNGISVLIAGADSKLINDGDIIANGGNDSAAIKLGAGADLNISGSKDIIAENSAHGVVLDTGAVGLSFDPAGTSKIIVKGTGRGIENTAEVANLKLTDVRIDVDGSGTGIRTGNTLNTVNSGTINIKDGVGLAFENTDGSTTDKALDMSGSQNLNFIVTGTGSGIKTNTSGDIKSGSSVAVNSAIGGNALTVGGTTTKVSNSGRLTSQSNTSALVSLGSSVKEFTNDGGFLENTGSARILDVNQAIHLTNKNGGEIKGDIQLTNGNNTITLADTSTAQTIHTGTGNDIFNLDGATENAFTSIHAGTGNDTLNLNSGTNFVLNTVTDINGVEVLNIDATSQLTLKDQLKLGDAADNGTGTLLKVDGTLLVDSSANYQMANKLAGTGNIKINTANSDFNFSTNTGSQFTGRVELENTKFALQGALSGNNNTTALKNATLVAGSGSTTSVANGTQVIGGLEFDGGEVKLGEVNFNTGKTSGSIETSNRLDISKTGTVDIQLAEELENQVPVPSGELGLLDQDSTGVLAELIVSTGTINGEGGNITVTNNGSVLSNSTTLDVKQGTDTVAQATYDYRVTNQDADGNKNGLYLNYGLTELDINSGKTLTLAAQTGGDSDLSAKLTGSGNLQIGEAGTNQVISLSNSANDYTGKTDIISSNTLELKADNALGNTSEVNLSSQSGLNISGFTQTINGDINAAQDSTLTISGGSLTANTVTTDGSIDIGQGQLTINSGLDAQTNSQLNLNGGTLNLVLGGDISGKLLDNTGTGQLNINGGDLNISSANSTLASGTQVSVAVGASANLEDKASLGKSSIINDGTVQFNLDGVAQSGAIENSFAGSGDLIIANTSITGEELAVQLTGNNAGLTGALSINSTVNATVTEQTQLNTGEINLEGTLNIQNASDWVMANTINSNLPSGSGTLNKQGAGTLTFTNDLDVGSLNAQSGVMKFGNNAGVNITTEQLNVDETATVNVLGEGSFTGNIVNKGMLSLNQNNGVTYTYTHTGNLTNDGIVIINGGDSGNIYHIAGDLDTTGNSQFIMATRLENLQGDLLKVDGQVSGNHKLTISDQSTSLTGNDTAILTVVETGGGLGMFELNGDTVDFGSYKYELVKVGNEWILQNRAGSTTPGGNGNSQEKVLSKRANAIVSFQTGLVSAIDSDIGVLRQRLGELRQGDHHSGFWTRSYSNSKQIDTHSSRKFDQDDFGLQVGADTQIAEFEGGNVQAGFLLNAGQTKMDFHKRSDAKINRFGIGLYSTAQFDNSFYVDVLGKVDHLDSKLSVTDNMGHQDKADFSNYGYSLSLEVGKTIDLTKGWSLEPYAQIQQVHINGKSYMTNDGMHVKSDAINTTQGRIGVALSKQFDLQNDIQFTPYIKASYVNNLGKDNSKIIVNHIDNLHSDFVGARGEYVIGTTLNIKENHRLYADFEYKNGSTIKQPWGVNLGYKFSF